MESAEQVSCPPILKLKSMWENHVPFHTLAVFIEPGDFNQSVEGSTANWVVEMGPECARFQADFAQVGYCIDYIMESLRLSYGLTARNPRVNAHPMMYKEWLIPAGTPVSQSAPFVLHDADIYPNPNRFDPERWLGSQKQQSDKYQIVFGRGNRQCLGINLAYAELYLASAALFRRYDYELAESSVEDVLLVRDYLISMANDPYKGVKVRICGKRV